MDGVIFNIVSGNRTESAETDMQRHIGRTDSLSGELAEQLRGEMKSSGGGRGRDLVAAISIDGLITLAINRASIVVVASRDVRRQGHFADLVGDREDVVAAGGEGDARESVSRFFQDCSREKSLSAEGSAQG